MKKRMLSILLLSLVGLLLLSGCGAEEKTLKVGLEAGYAPFNWTQLDDSNGAVAIEGSKEFAGGYDVQIAKKLAEGLGRELVIVKTEWDGLLPSVNSGIVDVIIAGMSPTEERKESIDFSDNYYTSDLVMIVQKDSAYKDAKTLSDFSGAKVTAQQSTFHYTVIDQIDGVQKETAMTDFPSMRIALQSGIIDAYVSERPEGVSAQAANDNFLMVELEDGFQASEDDVAVAVGLKKDSELTTKINEILSTISDEERQEIMDQAIMNQPAAQ